jgi:hypothetical protein
MSDNQINREADALFVEAQHAKTGPEQKAVDAKFQADTICMPHDQYAQFVRRIAADDNAAHAKHPNDNLPNVFVSDQHLVTWLNPKPEHK